MAMLSFDDQKSAAREDRVCQQYIGGTLCPGRSLYDRVYSLIDHVGKPTMHPKQEASTLPHLIPEEASSDAQDEYISQLMGYNDDCDTFDGPELGTIAPEGRPTKLKAAPKQRPPPTLYHPTFPAPQGPFHQAYNSPYILPTPSKFPPFFPPSFHYNGPWLF